MTLVYRKKPVTILAVRLVPGNDENILDFMRKTNCPFEMTGAYELVVHTLEGDMTAKQGDWLIQGVKGEFYPCRNDIFVQTYDKV